MEKADLGGKIIQYEARGAGEPVILIHGSVLVDTLKSLMDEEALLSRHRFIRYHRRGYLGTTHSPPPVSIALALVSWYLMRPPLPQLNAHAIQGGQRRAHIAMDSSEDLPDPERVRDRQRWQPVGTMRCKRRPAPYFAGAWRRNGR